MTQPSLSPSTCANASAASSRTLTELQRATSENPSVADSDATDGSPANDRSNSLGHLLGNVPSGATSGDISQFDVPDDVANELHQALEEMKSAYAQLMQNAPLSSNEAGGPAPDFIEGVDIDESSRSPSSPSSLASLNANAVYHLVQPELKLLEACWRRLLHQDPPIPLHTEVEQLECARHPLDQQVRQAREVERADKEARLTALVSGGIGDDGMDLSLGDENNAQQSVDEVHARFIQGNADLPTLVAARSRLMMYVRTRLKLLHSLVVDLTFHATGLRTSQPYSAATGLVAPAFADFEDALQRLPAEIGRRGAVRQIRVELAKAGKYLPEKKLGPWLLLARPDIQGTHRVDLARYKEALLDACSNTRADTESLEKFQILHTRVANETGIAAATLDLLGRNLESIRQYAVLATKDRSDENGMASPVEDGLAGCDAPIVRRAAVARNISAAGELDHAVRTHASALVDYIGQWTQRGLAVHWSELATLLTHRGITLSETQMHVIPLIEPRIERKGSWYCLKGEHPNFQHQFEVGSDSARLFRGQVRSANDDAGGDDGWCRTMLDRFPQGFGKQDAIDVLTDMAPDKRPKKLFNLWRNWCAAKLMQKIASRKWIINPEILCSNTRKTVSYGSGVEKKVSMPVKVVRPTGRNEVLRQSESDSLVLGKLLEMQLQGTLKDYHVRDAAGLAFNRPLLIERLCKEPGISARGAKLTLGELRPSDVLQMALNRQWERERWTQQEVPDLLKELHTRAPFFFFLSHGRIAKEINRIKPDRYMSDDCIGAFFNRCTTNGPLEEEIKRLINDKEMGLFYPGPTADFVSPVAIRSYLSGARGVSAGSHDLGVILKRYSSEILSQKPTLSKRMFDPANVQYQLDRTIAHFKLQKGNELPSWDSFEFYYRNEICNRSTSYFGKKAVELYFLLRSWLTGESSEMLADAPPKRNNKRHLSLSEVQSDRGSVENKRPAKRTQPMDTPDAGAKKARAARVRVPVATVTPTAAGHATAMDLPPDMPSAFDEFLEVYEKLRPTTAPAASGATTDRLPLTGSGEPSASASAASLASLQAGFGDVPRSHVVDVRSELGAAGLVVRESPKDGDCLFTALLADHDLSAANAKALRGRIALLLQGIPDTAESNARNANSVANYLFQRDEQNGLAQSAGIHSVPNRVRALLESLDGVLSDPDLTLPLVCRLMDGAAVPGDAPVYVTLLSEDDGHAVIYTASERTAISLRGLAPIELQQTTRQLCAASAVTVILKNDHFDRVQPA